MTDDLVKRLRDYPTNEDGFIGIEKTCEEAASRIEQLEAALRVAVGLISTMPPFDIDHPEEALAWVMEESAALGEKKDG
jgi:hypothetical protein